MTLNIENNMSKFTEQKDDYENSTKILSENIESLNSTLSNLNSTNVQEIYSSVIKNINTMKNETDKIGWKFTQDLDDYDSKFSEKLKNSLEAIDNQTVKIIEDLKEFKEISK